MQIVLYILYPYKVLDQLKGAEKNELEMGQQNEALEDKNSEPEKGIELGDIEETDFDAISMESVDSTVAASVGSEVEPKVEGSVLEMVFSCDYI
jgi:hypothetical protein